MKNFTLRKTGSTLFLLVFGILFTQAQQVVNTTADGNTPGTLRFEVINYSGSGTITFDPSIQGQTIMVTNGEIPITNALAFNIDGDNGGVPTTISGNNNSRIFAIQPGFTLQANLNNLSFIDGTADSGGALMVDGAATLVNINDCSFSSNIATGNNLDQGGGAILNDGATLAIRNTEFESNSASGTSGSGGAILNSNGGRLIITNAMFRDNSSNRAGGAIEDNANATPVITIDDSSFISNDAGTNPGNGGALHVSGSSSYTFNGGLVDANIAGKEGGGLWNNQGVLTINGTTISNNDARGNLVSSPLEIVGGGGIFAEDGAGSVIINEGTVINGNLATGVQGSGGGILMATGTTLTINGTVASPVVISGNRASRAGGGLEDWSLDANTNTLDNVNFNDNSAGLSVGIFIANGGPGNGGAIHVTGPGSNNITGGTADSNMAANEGGGFWNGSGTMNVSGTIVSANTASGTSATGAMNPGDAGGGGIFNEGGTLALMAGTEISGNFATGAQSTGGGILNAAGIFTAEDSEISGNESNRAGGGIETNGDSTVELTNISLEFNKTGVVTGAGAPGNGGGLHVSGSGTVNLNGGIVQVNTAENEGGGLWNGSGLMTVSGTRVSENFANGTSAAGAMNPGDTGGGGIYNEGGTLSLEANAVIINNQAIGAQSTGGGILNAAGILTVTDSEISGNESNRAGGGIETNGNSSVELTNVTLDGNETGVTTGAGAPGNGGGLHVSGSATIDVTDGTVSGNIAANEGGGLWNGGGIMTVSGTTLSSNTAAGNDGANPGGAGGGGIYNEGGTLALLAGAEVSGNFATGAQSTGGGILNSAGTLTATDSEISGNESNRAGGGIETNGASTVELNNITLDGNMTGVVVGAGAPGNGGGLHVSGAAPVTITGGSVSGNIAAKEGGGLWNNQGLLTVTGTTISNNDAQGDFVAGTPPEIVGGGGIFAEDGAGSVVINAGTVINGNIATGMQGSGGGILMATGTQLTINGTIADPVIISNNRASRAGGGIEDWSLDNNENDLTHVRFSGNSAGLSIGTFTANGGPGNGGAIHVTGPSSNNITGGRANANMAANEGGGFWNGSGTMTLSGAAVSNNTAAGNDDLVAGAAGGGGIFNEGGSVFLMQNSLVIGNKATGAQSTGGGVLNAAGVFTANDSEISGNESNRAGGGIETNGASTVELNNVTLDDNTTGVVVGAGAPGNGGGLHVSGAAPVTITGGSVSGNTAAKEGGGLWNNQGLLTINGTTISNNDAQGDFVAADTGAGTSVQIVGGGGIFSEDGAGTVVINEGTVIDGNTATGTQGSGGGILMATGTQLTINGTDADPVIISNNRASRAGGGLEDWSLNTNDNNLTNVNFTGNSAGLTIGSFAANGGPGNGGAIHVTGPGNNNITNGTSSGNTAAAEGGALWNNAGAMIVTNVTLDNNTAAGTAVDNGGGAVFNNGGNITVTNSTLSNNNANGSNGGAVANEVDGTLSIILSTISGNSSTLDGAGIYSNGTSVDLNAVTVANNNATGNGGGLASATGTFTLKNSLVAENTAASDVNVSGSISSNGFNLVEIDDSNALSAIASDVVGTTAAPEFAALGPLQDNGGDTQTHALMNGTRAQDIGDPADTFDDQIGQPVLGTRDAGAFEAQVTLGTDDVAGIFAGLRLYPNPTSNGSVNLELPNTLTVDASYQVIDMTGKMVAQAPLKSGLNNLRLESLSTGIYIVRLNAGNQSQSMKLIRE